MILMMPWKKLWKNCLSLMKIENLMKIKTIKIKKLESYNPKMNHF